MEKQSEVKIGLIGEQGVGKTHIINQYLLNRLPENPASTIAVEFATTIFTLRDDTRLKVEIWDTAGHEKYKEIVCVHLRNADGIVLVFDLLSLKSTNHREIATQILYVGFNEITKWLGKVRRECPETVTLALFGHRLDLVDKDPSVRKVDRAVAEAFAKENGLLYFQTTIKNAVVLKSAFEEILETIVIKKCKDQFQTRELRAIKSDGYCDCTLF